MPDRIIAVIPCYNVEKTCGEIIRRTTAYVSMVIAVDDGSTDRTYDELKKTTATILHFEQNRGKGAALKAGFEYAMREKADGIVILDSDDQHNPNEIPQLVEHFLRTQSDLVIGVRHLKLAHMPFIRMVSNRVSSWVISKLAKQKLTDTQSGFRVLSPYLIRSIAFTKDRFDMETEMIIKAARRGLKISEVPIETRYASGHGHFKGWPIRDVYRNMKIWIESLFWKA